MLERLKPAAEAASIRSSIALRGLHAAALHRRANHAEEQLEQLGHDAAFYTALGNIAEVVTIDESTNSAGESTNLPPKTFPEKHAFSSQSGYHQRMMARAPGQRTITTPTLPHRRFTQADMIDPRTGGTIAPETRKQRKAARKAATLIDSIQQERRAQTDRRNMLRDTGPNLFWQTAFHRLQERIGDNLDVRDGRISTFEAKTNKRMRGSAENMEQGEWARLRLGAGRIGLKGSILESKTVGRADTANRKAAKKARKLAKLEHKRRNAVIKKNQAKARR